jgi:hypothetical protein
MNDRKGPRTQNKNEWKSPNLPIGVDKSRSQYEVYKNKALFSIFDA